MPWSASTDLFAIPTTTGTCANSLTNKFTAVNKDVSDQMFAGTYHTAPMAPGTSVVVRLTTSYRTDSPGCNAGYVQVSSSIENVAETFATVSADTVIAYEPAA